MAFISAFDVIGPNMVGPSSSHTAGAASIALLAKKMMKGQVKKAHFTLFGSFAKTYRGHGTDRALLGGILGFSPDNLKIKDSFEIAQLQQIEYSFRINEKETEVHPNTVDIELEDDEGDVLQVRGESLGGGKVRIVNINGVQVEFTGEYSTLIVIHEDKPGVIAHITKSLSDCGTNIAFLRLFREDMGSSACSIVQADGRLPQKAIDHIKSDSRVLNTMLVQI